LYRGASLRNQIINFLLKAHSFCLLLLIIHVYFLLNLGGKAYRFYLCILLIKFVYFSAFAGVATNTQRSKIYSDLSICNLIYWLDVSSINTTQLRGLQMYTSTWLYISDSVGGERDWPSFLL
jgi:hypothetical protein